MQPRQLNKTINITILNESKHKAESFCLFNLLFTSSPDAIYSADTVYTVDGQSFTLSHNLKATDKKTYTPMQAFWVINDKDEIIGDLHLLSIGIVYYQERMKLPFLPYGPVELKKVQALINRTLIRYKKSILDDPISREYLFLEKIVEKCDVLELSNYYMFIQFYNSWLALARQWDKILVTLNTHQPISYHLHCFLHSTRETHFFIDYKKYFFQNVIIQFDRAMIRRQRSKPPTECFDILGRDEVGYGHTSTVHPVVALYVEGGKKCALKHPYVYKISARYALDDEFAATRDITHLQRARNYHPEFFALPDFGVCFYNYFQKDIKDKYSIYFIHTVLQYSARVYYAIAEQFKDKPHGDVKADNICIDVTGKLWLIDYRRVNNYTYHYVAPEVVTRKTTQSFAGDVYSAARMICEFWKDPHPIWSVSNEKPDLIVNEIACKNSKALLQPLFDEMESAYSEVEFPSELLQAYQSTLRKCHFRNPDLRPTALQVANAFEAVFQAYDAYFKKLDKNLFLQKKPIERRYRSRSQ